MREGDEDDEEEQKRKQTRIPGEKEKERLREEEERQSSQQQAGRHALLLGFSATAAPFVPETRSASHFRGEKRQQVEQKEESVCHWRPPSPSPSIFTRR